MAPASVFQQLQSWAIWISEATLSSLPAATEATLLRLSDEAQAVAREVDRVSSTVADVIALIEKAVGTFDVLQNAVRTLSTEATLAALGGLESLNGTDWGIITNGLDAGDTLLQIVDEDDDDSNEILNSTHASRELLNGACRSQDDCPLASARSAISALTEVIQKQATSLLAGFPDLVTQVLSSLESEDATYDSASEIGKCASTLTTLLDYPELVHASEKMLNEQTPRVNNIALPFFSKLEEVQKKAADVQVGLDAMRDAEAVVSRLDDARTAFTYNAQAELQSSLRTLSTSFQVLQDMALTPELLAALDELVSNLLVPAQTLIDKVRTVYEVDTLLDHLFALPSELVAKLASFDNGWWSSAAEVLPSTADLDNALGKIFDTLPDLASDVDDLAAANSTCLSDPLCQAGIQLRVRQLRLDTLELRSVLSDLPSLSAALQMPLSQMVDRMDLARELVDDMEVLASWSRSLSNQVPNATTEYAGNVNATNSSTTALLVQQLTRAMCKELEMLTKQGRDAVTPSFFELHLADYGLDCSNLDRDLVDVDNPFEVATDSAGEAVILFGHLAEGLTAFDTRLDVLTAETNDSVASARAELSAMVAQSNSYVDSHGVVVNELSVLQTRLVNMSHFFAFELDCIALREAIDAYSDTTNLTSLRDSAASCSLHVDYAEEVPFTCVVVPVDCLDTPDFLANVTQEYNEVRYEYGVSTDTIPTGMITGLSRLHCLLRRGATHLQTKLSDITDPLEKIVEVLLNGPAALEGKFPQYDKYEDPLCLAKTIRGSYLYRVLTFPVRCPASIHRPLQWFLVPFLAIALLGHMITPGYRSYSISTFGTWVPTGSNAARSWQTGSPFPASGRS